MVEISAAAALPPQASPTLSSNASSSALFVSDADMRSFYHNIEEKLSILPVLFMVIGTLGNGLAFFVLTRPRLRVQSTMLFFATLTVVDTLSLYQWNFNFFYKYQLSDSKANLENQSLFLCKYISFMAFFCMQTSAWILAVITIDRYFMITSVNWKQNRSRNMRFNLTLIGVITSLILTSNLPVLYFNGEVSQDEANGGRQIECYTSDYMIFWQRFSFFFECLLPLTLMILFNGLLIRRTYKSSRKLNVNQRVQNHIRRSVSMLSFNESNFYSANNRYANSSVDLKALGCRRAEDSSSEHQSKPEIREAETDRYSSSNFLSVDYNSAFSDKPRSRSMDEKHSNAGTRSKCAQQERKELIDLILNSSLASLQFLRFSHLVELNDLDYHRPPSFTQVQARKEASPEATGKRRAQFKIPRFAVPFLTERTRRYSRNERIVLMLSLLTLSFACSSLPSSIFYTFFRLSLYNQPYRRLLGMCLILTQHVSHAFNFIIYFTFSTIIKQQLNEIIRDFRLKFRSHLTRLLRCLVCIRSERPPSPSPPRLSPLLTVIGESRDQLDSLDWRSKLNNRTRGRFLGMKSNSFDQHQPYSSSRKHSFESVFIQLPEWHRSNTK
nr:G protein-coupled receptor [Proales similis]